MKNNSRYRILMFAPAFAPFANAEAYVNNKLALAMLNAGWDVEIISRKMVGQSSYDYGSGWENPWIPLKQFTHEIDYEIGNALTRMFDTIKSIIKMKYSIDGCRWADRAYDRAIALHKKKHFDVIISRAFPQYAHFPAIMLSQKTGVPWIANWNDPWLFLRQKSVKGKLRENIGIKNSYFCKKVSHNATWHTFPSERLRNSMSKYLGEKILDRSSVIPHVATNLNIKKMKDRKDLFKISYSGCISNYQDPKIYLEAMAQFIKKNNADGRVLFQFLGIDALGIEETASKLGIGANVRYMGKYSYYDSFKITAESDVLLVIDPYDARGVILASKFIDYVQTGRPILAIAPEISTLRDLISEYGGGIAVDCDSVEEIANALNEFYFHWTKNTLDDTYGSKRLYHLFSPERIISLYTDIFRDIGI